MAKPSTDRDYEVGFGKPPVDRQFTKGRSGNPKGRPKKRLDALSPSVVITSAQEILDNFREPVKLRNADGEFTVSSLSAVLQATKAKAIRGSPAAQKLCFDVNERAEAACERQRALEREQFGLLVQYVDRQRVSRSRPMATARDGPAWPHRDDVELDFRTCGGRVRGPIDALQAKPFFTLVEDYRLWQARLEQVSTMASHVSGDLRELYGLAIGAINGLLSAIRAQLPPSFSAQLDWEQGDIPAGALDIDGLNQGEIVNLALLPPECDQIYYGLYQLAAGAKAASAVVCDLARLDVSANTASLMNRLQIEAKISGGSAPLAPAVPEFADFYAGHASAEQSSVDEVEP